MGNVRYNMGVSINGGIPKWLIYTNITGKSPSNMENSSMESMVFARENPHLKWMMTGGTPISGDLHLVTGDLRAFGPEVARDERWIEMDRDG